MDNIKSFESDLYALNESGFDDIALRLFRVQAKNNPVYRDFVHNLDINPVSVSAVDDIPFLPISFFKSQTVKSGFWQPEMSFRSSGTTALVSSTHVVKDLSFYLQHARQCFEYFFGLLRGYHFLALLPSYLERKDSSLIAMMDYFIRESGSSMSGFYLHDINKLVKDVERARADASRKIIVWGVSFALLDLAEKLQPDLSDCLVFETGGMKGKRQEITRQELHGILQRSFGVQAIYSEYGMTELFSQAYTRGGSAFSNPPWMRVIIREVGDPFERVPVGKPGGINVLDLGNIHTCSFIETEDAGILNPDGTFEVQGRLDNSDIRGCNLMVE